MWLSQLRHGIRHRVHPRDKKLENGGAQKGLERMPMPRIPKTCCRSFSFPKFMALQTVYEEHVTLQQSKSPFPLCPKPRTQG